MTPEPKPAPAPVTPARLPLPDPATVRGTCPLCGQPTVVFFEYVKDSGYLFGVRCHDSEVCDYRRVD